MVCLSYLFVNGLRSVCRSNFVCMVKGLSLGQRSVCWPGLVCLVRSQKMFVMGRENGLKKKSLGLNYGVSLPPVFQCNDLCFS